MIIINTIEERIDLNGSEIHLYVDYFKVIGNFIFSKYLANLALNSRKQTEDMPSYNARKILHL